MTLRQPAIERASRTFHPSVEGLEGRCLLAAHIIGSPIVYPTIQSAVNAAAPGATIKVDAGVYSEQVTVNKQLTLLGAQAGVDARSASRGSTESIVNGQDFGGGNRSTSFYIAANDVTLDGFTVQGDTSSNVFGAGVVIAPLTAGTHVLDDVIQNNVAGLYLANSNLFDPAIIRHNVFANNNNPGNNNGRGIYTDGGVSGGNLTGVQIDSNTFIGNVGDGSGGNPQAAIGLETQTAGKQSNIVIINNIMSGNGKGVLMYNATNVAITGNVITGSTDATSAAIRIEGNVSNALLAYNTISGGLGSAVRIVDLFVGPSSQIAVNHNNFSANNGGGLVVDPLGYSGVLDATNNWWGSPSGPSGDGPGTGQALVTNGATILFKPWSMAPITSPSLAAGNLTVSGGAKQTLPGGAYTVNDLTLSGGSVLTFSGKATIYVTGRIDISGGSKLKALSGLSGDVQIHVLGSANVTISGGSMVNAFLDAPASQVTLSGGSILTGSLIDRLLNMSGGSIFVPSL